MTNGHQSYWEQEFPNASEHDRQSRVLDLKIQLAALRASMGGPGIIQVPEAFHKMERDVIDEIGNLGGWK